MRRGTRSGEALDLVTRPCPWDCGNGDGTMDVADFLAMLAQWGQAGTPCDCSQPSRGAPPGATSPLIDTALPESSPPSVSSPTRMTA